MLGGQPTGHPAVVVLYTSQTLPVVSYLVARLR